MLRNAAEAAEILAAGGLCALPTETVYGLAALAENGEAVARIYETKGRPRFNPLIVHCASLEQVGRVVKLDHCARGLAALLWPGPLTIVLEKQEDAPVSELAGAGLDTLAVRIPRHPLIREVIEILGKPIVAPSANRSGKLSPTAAGHVVAEFGDAVPVLDGGPCEAGIESTIISLAKSRPTLLRPGAIPAREVEARLGHPLQAPGGGIEAPGMLASHYAPNAALRLNAQAAREGEVLLGFGGTDGAALDLSPSGDLREAAANLFSHLRKLDERGQPIAVAAIPEEGLGVAINDRLRRAAAPRG
ncbi:L-threonylcarbamoyladenylate synthase [Parvularcula lutaonensis]|uniref:Threonylcarbamoyl-AMP synthase n=1 Tax=Parvularcula lutaonensis TaxID=491923 RepID=A0ABV7M9F9_9PROT|nr:L-threonylcarbamoyladenylate synthase [Parvularcula lutaonensis]GGY43208.1 threonylcarbamoyl-AMP synthase [Parvularcula lutaonensis]